jgi:hypothetical protein
MTALLERVKFLGGNGGSDEPDAPPLPDLDLGPEALDPDPQPAPETRSRRTARAAASKETAAKQPRGGGKFVSTAKIKKDMADEIESYAKMIALTWSLSDEHCAGVLNDTSAAIAADLANLASRSDWVMEKFQTTSLFADCMKTLHHLWPLIRAVYSHHISGRPSEQDQEEELHEPVTVVDPNAYGPWRPTVVSG